MLMSGLMQRRSPARRQLAVLLLAFDLGRSKGPVRPTLGKRCVKSDRRRERQAQDKRSQRYNRNPVDARAEA